MTRREFLAMTAALTATPLLGDSADAGVVPGRKLGRTGATVSALGLGGFHVGVQPRETDSVRLIRSAIDAGVTFLDNCWDYNGGESERRVGKALRDGYRARAFVMTKIDGRDRATAARQIDESLGRLAVDHLDLLQLHEVIHQGDPDRAFAPGGAIEAMVEARRAGKARFLGFTGHKSPDLHLAMLRAADAQGFRFDAVQMPLNVLDAHHDSFERRVLPVLLEKGIGVLGMKAMGGGPIIEEVRAVSPAECLRYAMSLPVSVTIAGMDSPGILEHHLKVARGFSPMSEAQVNALLARTAPAASGGVHERYKTSTVFDGTTQHPEWLGHPA